MARKTWTTELDSELLEACRLGDNGAYAALWERHHRAGLTAARNIAPRLDAGDLVSESYLRILELVRDGRGPTGAFRPYLYRVIRTVASDTYRPNEDTSDNLEDIPNLTEAGPWEDGAFDRNSAAKAFAGLSERWQSVLWYTVVEGLPPREAAKLLGMSANGVSALAIRAREALQSGWVEAHVDRALADAACQFTLSHLQKHQRGKLTAAVRREVDQHLDECDTCPKAAAEFSTLNSQLALVLASLFVGGGTATALLGGFGQAAPAVAATGVAGGSTAVAAGTGSGSAAGSAAGTAAAGSAAAGTVGAGNSGGLGTGGSAIVGVLTGPAALIAGAAVAAVAVIAGGAIVVSNVLGGGGAEPIAAGPTVSETQTSADTPAVQEADTPAVTTPKKTQAKPAEPAETVAEVPAVPVPAPAPSVAPTPDTVPVPTEKPAPDPTPKPTPEPEPEVAVDPTLIRSSGVCITPSDPYMDFIYVAASRDITLQLRLHHGSATPVALDPDEFYESSVSPMTWVAGLSFWGDTVDPVLLEDGRAQLQVKLTSVDKGTTTQWTPVPLDCSWP